MSQIVYRPYKGEHILAVVNGLPWTFYYCPIDGLYISVPHRPSGTRKCTFEAWQEFSRKSLVPFLMVNGTEIEMELSEFGLPLQAAT